MSPVNLLPHTSSKRAHHSQSKSSPMLDRNHKMRTKIMAYHRQFQEARVERRQAEYDAIGEQIFANACNWLRVPGQRRTERGGSMYRVPTPHPSHRRRIDEAEDEDESSEERDYDELYNNDLSSFSTGQLDSPRGPVQLQRRGGRRVRHPIYRRDSSSEELEIRDEAPLLYYPSDNNHGRENHHDHPEPTPEQEIQAIVRNVQQRRQVVVIQPTFPYPNYSAGEIVDESQNTTRRANCWGEETIRLINAAAPTNISNHAAEHSDSDIPSYANTSSLPLPPGVSDNNTSHEDEDEAPVYSLPSPALDLSSANLTGSLFTPPAGLSPGVLFPSVGQINGQRRRVDENVITIEHVEDVSRESEVGNEEIIIRHADARYRGYRDASTSMRD